MPNRKYESGRRYEYKVRDLYRTLGYTVIRAAGSKSPFDLVAVDPKGADGRGYVRFIQTKSLKKGTKASADRIGRAFMSKPPLGKAPNRQFAQVMLVRYGREEALYVV